jgi:tetratricopeptide (TPR) repeat protein
VFDGTLRQALAIDLAQSRFLSLVSDEGLRASLQLMNRNPGEPLGRATALEVCRRRGLDSMLDGAIVRLGNEYVLTLEAIGCGEGERVASSQARADRKERVLDALSRAASDMRAQLGESLASIRNSDRPLREVTTSSLEALQAFTLGSELMRHGPDSSAGIPHFEQAIALDPAFASAHAYLALLYSQLAEFERAAELQGRAYALRDRVSERERYHITASWHSLVTGDLDREIATYELWAAQYPRDWLPRMNLAEIQAAVLGNYRRALSLASEAEQLEPEQPYSAAIMAAAHMALNELGAARKVLDRALARKLDHAQIHEELFRLAVLQGDTALAAAQRSWSAQQPVQGDIGWLLAAEMGLGGHLKEFRAAKRAHARALSAAGFGEAAAYDLSRIALVAALYGDAESAADAAAALASSPGRDALRRLAFAHAFAGRTAEAAALLEDFEQRYPHDLISRRIDIPLTRALLGAREGKVTESLQSLESLRRFDSGRQWSFHPLYVRGLLLLQKGDGAAAEEEFRKIIDQRGVSPFAPEWELAHLGAARAAALVGSPERAQAAYRRFLDLWKTADADIPVLREARAELARINENRAAAVDR